MPVASSNSLRRVVADDFEHILGEGRDQEHEASIALLSPVYYGTANVRSESYFLIKNERTYALLRATQHILESWQEASVRDDVPDEFRDQLGLAKCDAGVGSSTTGDGVFEAVRHVAMLMVRAYDRRESWGQASAGFPVERVKEALLTTDLGSLWGHSIGVLYWIVLVMHCATFRTSEYLFYHGLLSRIFFELTYRYSDWRGAVEPLIRLRFIEDLTSCRIQR